MGDRGNIRLRYSKEREVYFYTHWRGSEIPDILREALCRGKNRWSDAPYLARIIFDTLTDGDRELTGFGIDVQEGDNEHRVPTVDLENRTVDGVPFESHAYASPPIPQ